MKFTDEEKKAIDRYIFQHKGFKMYKEFKPTCLGRKTAFPHPVPGGCFDSSFLTYEEEKEIVKYFEEVHDENNCCICLTEKKLQDILLKKLREDKNLRRLINEL